MSVLNQKLRRELLRTRGLLLAIASIMVVGIMSFVQMRSLYHNLKTSQSEYYAQCRMADFWIDLKKAPLTELEQVAQLPGVVDIRPRIQFYATVDLPQVRKPLNGLVLTLPDQRVQVINDVVMQRGGYFTGRDAAEVIVNDAFARAHGLQPGETIHLLLNNRRQELLIVGTAISSEFVYLLGPGAITPDPEHFGVFYVQRGWAEEVFDMDGAANGLVGRLTAEIRERPDEVLGRIERMLEPFGALAATARKDQASNFFLSAEIRGLGVFATILPGIFLLVAALVLNVLMARLAEQQRTVIGTLKAIGYDDRQVFVHFLKYGLVVGVAGGVLGCIAGYWAAEGVTSVYRRFFEFPKLENHFYPGIYIAGIMISMVCALAGSLRGARVALRLHPAEAMRDKPPVEGGAIWLERFGWLWQRLTFPWRMALRSTVRHRLRTAVGLFSAAIGTSLLVVTFMSVEATTYLIDFQFEKIARSDLDLTFDSERGADALDEARRLPAVDRAEPVLHVACRFAHGSHHRKGSITGLAHDARLTIPRNLEGHALRIPETGLLMTRKVADLLHVSVGDLVTVQPIKGLRRSVEMPVVEIAESYLGTSVYADIEYLSRLTGEALALTGVQLALHPDEQQQAALYRELKQLPSLQAASARADVVDNLNKMFIESLNISIGMLVTFAGVIFFGSILNASLVSLAERMREIATLRVLGYGEWQIGFLLLRESVLVNSLGVVLGMPLGYLLYLLMARVYDMELMRLPVVAPPWVWIVSALLAAVFGGVAHLVVQRRIHRLDWLEALQVKE